MASVAFGGSRSQAARVRRPRLPIGELGLRISAFTYLALFVGVPLVVIHVRGLQNGFDDFAAVISRPIASNALWLSIWTAAFMTVINVIMGTLTAFVLVKYDFPGKRLFNAVIDLPIAIPTLVTGVMLVLLYGPQTPIGSFVEETFGVRIIFSTPGIILALLFISFPFVTRTIQPVLLELDASQQEAAYTLGASPIRTFVTVILPVIRPAIMTGGLLSFARALGEFGSVVLVAGNIPMESLTSTVYVYQQVEGDNIAAAAAVSVVLFGIAFSLTLLMDLLQRRTTRANS